LCVWVPHCGLSLCLCQWSWKTTKHRRVRRKSAQVPA
jgi:hypothetical protein